MEHHTGLACDDGPGQAVQFPTTCTRASLMVLYTCHRQSWVSMPLKGEPKDFARWILYKTLHLKRQHSD